MKTDGARLPTSAQDVHHGRLRALPPSERPRERLFRLGPEALADAELLAILLGTGDGQVGVVELARRVLALCRDLGAGEKEAGLRFLAVANLEELGRVRGVGPAKAAQLKAAVELGRRIAREGLDRLPIRGPDDCGRLFLEALRHLEQEHFDVLLLDARHRVISLEHVFVGGLDTTPVHPREVFRAAIRKGAASVVLGHNHPSGDPSPSQDDLDITRRLADAGRLLGIEVVDHIVVGDTGYVSFTARGIHF